MSQFAKIALTCTLIAGGVAVGAEPGSANTAAEPAIAAQPLATALDAIGRQTGLQIVYVTELVEGKRSKGAPGGLGAEETLKRVLEGTGLTFKHLTEHVVSIQPEKEGGARVGSGGAQSVSASDSSVDNEKQSAAAAQMKSTQVEEVVVTGSRLPTLAKQGAQEVRSYSSERIRQSGQGTVAEFLNTLPEVSIAAIDGPLSPVGNYADQTSVQLHGLPRGTTLVLLNGRRVEVNNYGFFDLNNIPVSAIERIEVLPGRLLRDLRRGQSRRRRQHHPPQGFRRVRGLRALRWCAGHQ